MDWYSWLSRSGLEPSLVYDYSLLFTHNELEDDDVPHFNHEFLLSMGVSIAKHRLEILKLAKKQKAPRPVAMLMSAVVKTRKCIARCLSKALPAGRDRTAIVLVPKPAGVGGGRWKGTMLKRSRTLVILKQGRLMIGDKIRGPGDAPAKRGASPLVASGGGGGGDGDEFWGGGGEEEMRWDSMFHDLKPT